MNSKHLNDDELNRALLGDELAAEAAEHVAACLACKRRRDSFMALAEEARGADPDQASRVRVRERALALWDAPSQRHWLRWVAAAAAVVVLGVLPLLRSRTPAPPVFNADAVLNEVNQVLDRDPLSAMASDDVVNTVVPVTDELGERSTS
jgi:hypothetical protein